MVADASRLGRLAMVCRDFVGSLIAIMKRAYNYPTARGVGGMVGATTLEKEVEVVLQA